MASAAEACGTAGPDGRLVKPVTAKLTLNDMISPAAYPVSLRAWFDAVPASAASESESLLYAEWARR